MCCQVKMFLVIIINIIIWMPQNANMNANHIWKFIWWLCYGDSEDRGVNSLPLFSSYLFPRWLWLANLISEEGWNMFSGYTLKAVSLCFSQFHLSSKKPLSSFFFKIGVIFYAFIEKKSGFWPEKDLSTNETCKCRRSLKYRRRMRVLHCIH